MQAIDRVDQSILDVLENNARITLTELANRVGLSKTPCQVRMRRLGVRHIAFVEVTLSDTRSGALKAFNQAVQSIVEVEQCHMIAGDFDYLLKIRTEDMDNYRVVLGEKISTLPHVKNTSTFVVMESVKDNSG